MTWLSQKLKAEAKIVKMQFLFQCLLKTVPWKTAKLAFGEMEAQKEYSDWLKVGDKTVQPKFCFNWNLNMKVENLRTKKKSKVVFVITPPI